MNASQTVASDPYRSRADNHWEAVPRRDPVVWGPASGPLAPEEVERYRQTGFLAFPQLISTEEAAQLRTEAERLAAEAQPGDEGVITESGSERVRSIFRVHRNHARFREVCRDPRIVDWVRQVLGSDVYIHQSRINYKPAFDGKEFFWHSDFETWHVEDGMPRMRAISVSLSLTENHEFNGPLMVVPGSHHTFIRCVGSTPAEHYHQSLKKQEYGVPSREAMAMLVENSQITAPKGPPGSAVAFECNLMHGSVGNLSPTPRTNLFVVYNSVENALQPPFGQRPPRPDFLAERAATPIAPL